MAEAIAMQIRSLRHDGELAPPHTAHVAVIEVTSSTP
jgi:hypothetical protein